MATFAEPHKPRTSEARQVYPFATGCTNEDLLKTTSVQAERALLVGVADPVIAGRFMVPQREGAVLAALEAGALIMKREFAGDFVDLSVEGPASLLGRYREYRQPPKLLRVGTGRGGGSGATSHETGPV